MFNHVPVLYQEVLEGLQVKPGGVYLDGTLGGGGHARGILEASAPDGKLIGMDQDREALAAARQNLAAFGARVVYIHDNFLHLKSAVAQHSPQGLDGVLLDIGVSSYQLDEARRGFSYMRNAPLDMRMNTEQSLTCRDLVNQWSEDELTDIIATYGEERWARRIAKIILERRAIAPLETTFDLVDAIERAIPVGAREKGSHVAKRTFQALRIAVNDELFVLEKVLEDAVSCLKPGGRIAVITFHSLEDRIVKEQFRTMAAACVCPPELPVCNCNKKSTIKVVTRKPRTASREEREANKRAASAKLRVAEKKKEAGEQENG